MSMARAACYFGALYVVGDSLFDNGNNAALFGTGTAAGSPLPRLLAQISQCLGCRPPVRGASLGSFLAGAMNGEVGVSTFDRFGLGAVGWVWRRRSRTAVAV